jgi:hypothetical protein
MITKGDALFHLGKIEDARGSMKGVAKTSYGTKAGYGDVSLSLYLTVISHICRPRTDPC